MIPPPFAAKCRQWLAAAADVVWPRACLVCDAEIGDDTPPGCVCAACRAEILTDPHETCPRCTSTVGPHTDTSKGCLRCRGAKFHFDSAVRLGPYAGRLRDAILRMKQPAGEPLAETLGELWATARRELLLRDSPAVVIPVPLHWRRRWARGYNQSESLARGVARGLGLPFLPRALARIRATPSQVAQTPAERRENVRGAFRCVGDPFSPALGIARDARPVPAVRVLLVDDVLTTGATADAAAEALRTAGAAQVTAAVLAHR